MKGRAGTKVSWGLLTMKPPEATNSDARNLKGLVRGREWREIMNSFFFYAGRDLRSF